MGLYQPPAEFEACIRTLDPGDYDEYSSTLVREFIKTGGEWRDLVPGEVVDLIEKSIDSYSPALASRNARSRWLRLG